MFFTLSNIFISVYQCYCMSQIKMKIIELLRKWRCTSTLLFQRNANVESIFPFVGVISSSMSKFFEPLPDVSNIRVMGLNNKIYTSAVQWNWLQESLNLPSSSYYVAIRCIENEVHITNPVKIDSIMKIVAVNKTWPMNFIIGRCSDSQLVEVLLALSCGRLFLNNTKFVTSIMTIDLDTSAHCLNNCEVQSAMEQKSSESESHTSSTMASEIKNIENSLKEQAKLSSGCMKPPNVMIYCGKKDTSRLFDRVKAIFQQCLNPDKYVIYHLKHDQVLKDPWKENTSLLIISCEKFVDDVDQVFLDYYRLGGKLLSFCSSLEKAFLFDRQPVSETGDLVQVNYYNKHHFVAFTGKFVYSAPPKENMHILATMGEAELPAIIKMADPTSNGSIVFSQVLMDKDATDLSINPDIYSALKQATPTRLDVLRDILAQLSIDSSCGTLPKPSHCVLWSNSDVEKVTFLSSLESRLNNGLLTDKNICLRFTSHPVEQEEMKDVISVLTEASWKNASFDFDVYQQKLSTRYLGKTVIYADVVTTTMAFINSLMLIAPEGIVVSAARQLSGKGRGGNVWLSPEGCAMFSVYVKVPLHSELGRSAAYIQHLTSLAVVESITALPGYENLNLRVKWPNDIYFGDSMKLGGVLVTSSLMRDMLHANIGCGINFTNSDPTMCINDVINLYNKQHGTNLSKLTIPEVIALTLSSLEHLIDLFQTQGREHVLQRYYKRWLHSGSVVHLENESGPEATILGLDEHGYLSVQLTDGSRLSVHPDGNSLDMTKNLVIPKK